MVKQQTFVVKSILISLEESFQIVLSIGLIVLGIRGFSTSFEQPLPISGAFPITFLIFYFSFATIGGVCSLLGVYLSYKSFWFSGLERLGLYMSAPAWGSYAIINYANPVTNPSVFEFSLFIAISLACLFHADAIDKQSQEILKLLRINAANHLLVDE